MYNTIRVRRSYPELKWTGKPWSDNKMEYIIVDEDETEIHRYILKLDHVKKITGIDLQVEFGSKEKAEIFLVDTSNFIYDYLYDNERPENQPIIEYMIAKKSPLQGFSGRKAILRAMEEQVKYALQSDGDLVGQQTGINLNKGTVIKLSDLRGRREIAAGSERALRSAGFLRGMTMVMFINPDDYRFDY